MVMVTFRHRFTACWLPGIDIVVLPIPILEVSLEIHVQHHVSALNSKVYLTDSTYNQTVRELRNLQKHAIN